MAIFAPQTETQCLYSTVRNMLPREVYLGFLPQHGKRAAAGEEITVFGDVQHHFARQTPNERGRRSLENALKDGNLAIVKGPSVFLYDDSTDETKILTLAGGSFVAADPCWGEYSSSISGLGG